MSCASVKCSSKNVSATLRKRCCNKGGGITPAATRANPNPKPRPKALVERLGEKPEGRPASTFDKIINPSRQTEEDKGGKSKKIGLFQDVVFPATDPEDKKDVCEKDCEGLDLFCQSAKFQADCGGDNCLGLEGINCGYLAIGVAAAIILFMVLK